MSFDNLPTDNLYKFLTLLGMALLGFSLWMEDGTSKEFNKAFLKNSVLTEMLQQRVKELNDDRIFFLNGGKNVDASTVEQNPARVKTMLDSYDTMGRELESLRLMLADAQAQQEYIERNSPKLTLARWIGVAMSLLGFLFWYFHHQRFQDQIIRREARIG